MNRIPLISIETAHSGKQLSSPRVLKDKMSPNVKNDYEASLELVWSLSLWLYNTHPSNTLSASGGRYSTWEKCSRVPAARGWAASAGPRPGGVRVCRQWQACA